MDFSCSPYYPTRDSEGDPGIPIVDEFPVHDPIPDPVWEAKCPPKDERPSFSTSDSEDNEPSLKRKKRGECSSESEFFSEIEARLGDIGSNDNVTTPGIRRLDDETPSNRKKRGFSSLESESLFRRESNDNNRIRRIGKILVSSREIGRGRDGTIVFEGTYEDRPVAVKRLVQEFYPAINEHHILKHRNIVRYYGMERQRPFVYLALERCPCNLSDFILALSGSSVKYPACYESKLDSIRHVMQGVQLWSTDGHPTPLLMKLMRDMVEGLVYLHGLGLVYLDLEPYNILIAKNPSLHAQLADVGITKCIPEDESRAIRRGWSGWQAPEQLLRKELQSRTMDVFSLGLVLFFCVSRGEHPFGELDERESNIEDNIINLSSAGITPEAHDLFSLMLNRDPKLRPKALEVLHHPFFRNSETRISFFRDISDRVLLEANRFFNRAWFTRS